MDNANDLPDVDRLLTAREAASMASISSYSLRRWSLTGRAPAPISLGSRSLRWRLSEIRDWLNGERPT